MSDQQQGGSKHSAYHQKKRSLIIRLLIIWFVVSFGFGLLLVEPLNEIRLGGYKLGFWFAQQGSIFVFIALIFYFSRAMSRFERESQEDQQ
jgi:putative solute:sodium symporter small subunit